MLNQENPKKLKIILDGTQLEFGLNKNGDRRGIFFVTYNLITELSKRNNVSICIYLNKGKSSAVKKYIKKEWPNLSCDFYIYKPLVFFELYKKFSKTILLSRLFSFLVEFQKRKQKKYLYSFFEKHEYNTYLSTANKVPGIFSDSNLVKFTIVHDLIPIVLKDFYDASKLGWFFRLLESFNSSDYYFTDSENTKKDLFKYAPQVNKDHVFTSYISCGECFSKHELTDSVRKKYNIPLNKRYMFSLFTLDPKKNLERNISSFLNFKQKHNIENFCFVIGGGSFALNKDFSKKMKEKFASDSLIFTGYIDDEDLPCIYSEAEWFVFTSMYEGFGLPPLEAMKCGCPVIVSNSSSLPEVVGNAGIQIDWDSDEQHLHAYEKYYFDRNFREDAIQKGFVQAQKFSWNKTVDFMLERMEKTLNSLK